MINKILLIIFMFGLGSLSAQSFKPYLSSTSSVNNASINTDTLKILAIMVNFQEDKDGTTFGNGKFGSIYSTDYGNSILDPLPHDKQYFEDHLTFVKNYFDKVSKGNLYIEFTVLPDTFSVSKTMRNYSPVPGSDSLTNVADFSVEAWTLADQIYPGFDFSSYNLFTVFHAGVGRDISLPGSIGNERDLPSVYLSEKSFKNIYGESFEGIPVSGGSFKITNSMIMPETESRELATIVGTALFQITINGLLAASIGSHLGLPDLFDTETGLSAIGRFGLMDGQGIFAYNGTYPPEPSPWSKIYLGWAEPVTIDLENSDINIVTDLAAELGDTVILKVPLNSSEYYLIENRARDANKDGSVVTYRVDGSTITRTFTKDTTGYYSFDVDSLSGVVLDVDEFDWAVPGNGIVIWHIDENVIDEKLVSNKINTDKYRRGVDVEEADGVQDIGEIFRTILGDEVIGEGTELDFWFSSNSAGLYSNRFAKDTRPNTLTNTGANSLITIKDFSDISNKMSFKIEYGDSIIKPVMNFHFPNRLSTGFLSAAVLNGKVYYINIVNLFDLFITDGENIITQVNNFTSSKPSSIVTDNVLYIFGNHNKPKYWMTDGGIVNSGTFNLPSEDYTSPVINLNKGDYEVSFGTDSGKIYTYTLGGLPDIAPALKNVKDLGNDYKLLKLAMDNEYFAVIASPNNGLSPEQIPLFVSTGGNVSLDGNQPVDIALTKSRLGKYIAVVLTRENNIFIIEGNKIINKFKVESSFPLQGFSLTDLKGDGNNYILINNGKKIEAYNFNGASADNFSVDISTDFGLERAPITADIEGDAKPEVISISWDGVLYAIDGGKGNMIPGFPISIGAITQVTPVLYNYNGKTYLAAANSDGLLAAWSISSVEGNLSWSEENGNRQNTSFIDAASTSNIVNEFLPESRAYNYPNPVYGNTTNIRYYVSEDANINIKMFDLAGDFVAELNDVAQGGMDNETVWDVSGIQSGVYFARIEAVGSSGKSEFVIIKVAVVK